MNKSIKKIVVCFVTMTFVMLLSVGCSKQSKIESFLKEYTKAWNEGNYEVMYEKISSESQQYITKDRFIERYKNIYSAMKAENIKLELNGKEENLQIPVNLSMESIAGDFNFDNFKIKLTKEDKKYKIVWNENLIIPGMEKDDKVRVMPVRATRGSILDKDGNKLAYDGEVNSIYVHPKVFDENKEENIYNLSQILDVSQEYIVGELNKNNNPDYLVPIVKVSNYEQNKADLCKNIQGVVVKREISRVYINGEAYGNLLGYIGNITEEELNNNKGKGYKVNSKIGKNGLEKIYEDTLKAEDGVHIYLERGEEKITIAKKEGVNGEDIQLSIDSKLQEDVYKQMKSEKGASVAMDPKTGEVLAMVSSPSYDSNILVTYKTKSIAKKWEESNNAEFQNRANDTYSPGSTMKLITASIGLENKVINPEEAMNISGLNWQKDNSWGDYYVTRVKDPKKHVNLYDATKYSDNIYFADKAIKIGEGKFMQGAAKFGIGQEVPFEYPMQTSQISSSGKLDNEILLGDTGYGQGQVLMTPLDVTMAYSALGNQGKIMQPRLVISENPKAIVYKEAISSYNLQELIKCFTGVIKDSDGSGYEAKIDGINLAGKTGTAEIKKSKDDENGTQNGWFVAVDTDNSEIAISMIIEDVKDKAGSKYVVPIVGNVVKNYLSR